MIRKECDVLFPGSMAIHFRPFGAVHVRLKRLL